MSNFTTKDRTLAWTCIVYPNDSLPDNWREILNNQMVAWAMSPVHDADINPDGELKKPHRHLLLSFKTKKSFRQIKPITDLLKGSNPQPCRDTRGLVRYFLHLDNPEKAQYKRAEIASGGGFDVENALSPTQSEESALLREILAFIDQKQITEFKDLTKYILDERPEWFSTLRKNTFFTLSVIKSQRHILQKQVETVCKECGAVSCQLSAD